MALVITDQQPLLRVKKAGHFRTFHIFTSCENTRCQHVWWERMPGKFLVFFGRAAFSPPQVKMLRPGQKRMWKHSGCPAENLIFFFKSTIYKNFSEKKRTFVGPSSSSSESLMNDVRKITAGMRCFIKERYCVAVWKEERGAVRGEESASWRAHFNLSSAQPFDKVNIERGAA